MASLGVISFLCMLFQPLYVIYSWKDVYIGKLIYIKTIEFGKQKQTSHYIQYNKYYSRSIRYIIFTIKICPDYATFPLGTRDSAPMEHCSTLSQRGASASNNV